jgi:carboxylesterase type B
MPAATGTFRRAILQSTPQTYFMTDLAAEISAEICREHGRTPSVADLADVAPDDLVAATGTVTRSLPQRLDRWGPVAYASTPFAPVVDADVLPSARRGLRSPMARPEASSCWSGTAATSTACSPPNLPTSTKHRWTS